MISVDVYEHRSLENAPRISRGAQGPLPRALDNGSGTYRCRWVGDLTTIDGTMTIHEAALIVKIRGDRHTNPTIHRSNQPSRWKFTRITHHGGLKIAINCGAVPAPYRIEPTRRCNCHGGQSKRGTFESKTFEMGICNEWCHDSRSIETDLV